MLKRAADGTVEIDLSALLKILWKRIWIIIIAAVIGGVATFCYAEFKVTPLYQSSVKMYVNNSGGASSSSLSYLISTTELSAAQSLVETYIVILGSRTCLNEVSQKAGVNYDYKTIKNMISASAVNETEIFEVTVTATSAQEAQTIANTIAEVLPARINDIVESSSVKVVDYAPLLPSRTYPSILKFAAIGILAGAFIAILVIVVLQLMDDYIHSDSYLTDTYPDIPLLASIPDLTEKSNAYAYNKEYGYSYGYGYGKIEAETDDQKGAN